LMVKKKPKTVEYIFTINYKSKSNNNYILEVFTYNYAYWKKKGCVLDVAMDFHYHGGRNLLSIAYGDNDYIWISPHFMQRYKERFLQSDEKDIGMTFLRRNTNAANISTDCERYKGSLFCYVNDGIVLGHNILPKVIWNF